MKGLKYQLKSIRRDKMCLLTFLLPVIVGIAINLLSGVSFQTMGETTFGVVGSNITDDTVEWLQNNGVVVSYETRDELEAAVNNPSTQMIGVWQTGNMIQTFIAGDELAVNKVIANTLPQVYENRATQLTITRTIIPVVTDNEGLKSLFIVITLVTAMFMGCTFNAMNIISEKEDGIEFINQVLPVSMTSYIIQKTLLGFIGGTVSTIITALICMRIQAAQVLPFLLIVLLSAYISALIGLLCKRSDGRNCLHQNCNDPVPCSTHFLLFDSSKRQYCFQAFVFSAVQCNFLWSYGLDKWTDERNRLLCFGSAHSCGFLERSI